MKFVGETGLRAANPGQIVEEALKELSSFYVARKREGADVILDLSESTVRIRICGVEIWVRVEAPDLALCHATKMLVESSLSSRADYRFRNSLDRWQRRALCRTHRFPIVEIASRQKRERSIASRRPIAHLSNALPGAAYRHVEPVPASQLRGGTVLPKLSCRRSHPHLFRGAGAMPLSVIPTSS